MIHTPMEEIIIKWASMRNFLCKRLSPLRLDHHYTL
jgi:hypothetical protein